MPDAKYLENPVPHLKEAQKSAAKIIDLEKQLLGHRAELLAIRQIKKVSLAACGLVFAVLALAFGLGWCTIALHEAGWSAGTIAIISFILLGLVASVFSFLFLRSLEIKEDIRI